MASSFLTPPSSYSLSDRVIGGVVQRVGSRLGLSNENETREVSRYTKPRQTFAFEDEGSSPMDKLPLVGRKRQPDLDALADLATTHSTSVSPFTTAPILMHSERKMKVSASRRERCRINQARYRKRQRKYAQDLDEGIRSLQGEIQGLETHRQGILRRAPTNENVWVVATEYFRLFRHGYMAPIMGSTESSSHITSRISRPLHESHAQLDFLRATMAPDVTDGIVCGAEALLENWKLLSQYFSDVNVQLKCLEQVATDSLLATTVVSATITDNTLCQVFPHLVDEGGRFSSLGEKLRNQRVVLRGSVRFDWDASMGRVSRHESIVDGLTPLLQLLGSLKDVATVFDKALVTPEGKFLGTKIVTTS